MKYRFTEDGQKLFLCMYECWSDTRSSKESGPLVEGRLTLLAESARELSERAELQTVLMDFPRGDALAKSYVDKKHQKKARSTGHAPGVDNKKGFEAICLAIRILLRGKIPTENPRRARIEAWAKAFQSEAVHEFGESVIERIAKDNEALRSFIYESVVLDRDQPNSDWVRPYLELPVWNQFPVLAFSGRTTLADAITSELMENPVRSSSRHEIPSKDVATLPLSSIRFAEEPSLIPVDYLLARLNASPRLVLFGEAGDGKSTLLRVLARHLLKDGKFPVLIRARDWEQSGTSLRTYVEGGSYFESEVLGRPSSRPLAQAGGQLWEFVEGSRAPILVDGLDEAMNPEYVGNALHALPGNPPVVVTSRRIKYRNALPDFEPFDLYPFDFQSQVRPYVEARLGDNSSDFLDRLDSDPRVRALTGSGLMLAMLCTHWEQMRDDSRDNFDLPIARDELYQWATDYLLGRPERVGRTTHATFHEDKALKQRLLNSIAFHSQFCALRALDIPKREVKRSLAEVHTTNVSGIADDLLLEDIVQNSELLTEAIVDRSVRFFHPSFQEFFAACYLNEQWAKNSWDGWFPKGSDENAGFVSRTCLQCGSELGSFASLLTKDAYQETLLLMVGMMDDANREAAVLASVEDDIDRKLRILARSHFPHPQVASEYESAIRYGYIPPVDVLQAIGGMRSNENLRSILGALGRLLKEQSEAVKVAALVSVAGIARFDRDGEVAVQLEQMLDQATNAELASRVIQEIGPPAATRGVVVRLLRLLESERNEYLGYAQTLCRLTGCMEFRDALFKLAEDEDNEVRTAAVEQIKRHEYHLQTRRATDLSKRANYKEAIQILNDLIEARFNVLETRCHLARAYFLSGNFMGARIEIEAGWSERNSAKPYVLARLQWFKAALAMLDNQDVTPFLNALRTTLESESAHETWEIAECLAVLSTTLPEWASEQLSSLAHSINTPVSSPS